MITKKCQRRINLQDYEYSDNIDFDEFDYEI